MDNDAAQDPADFRPLSAVRALHVILTLRCNYRCAFCFQPNFHDDLPESVWKEKLLPLYPSLTEIVVHGGEPTVAPAFVEFCDLVRSVNQEAEISLFTNGFRFHGYWPELISTRGGFVNFSVNAASRDMYATVNRRDNFDSVIDTVRSFGTQVRDEGSRARIDLSYVITRENVSEIADFVRLGAELGVHRVRFYTDLGGMPDASQQTAEILQRAYGERDRAGLEVWGLEIFEGRLFNRPVADEYLESTGCQRTVNSLYVAVNGDVSYCPFLEKKPIGNLVSGDLASLWNSPSARAQRRAQLDGDWTYCRSAYCGPTENVPMDRPAVLLPLPVVGQP